MGASRCGLWEDLIKLVRVMWLPVKYSHLGCFVQQARIGSGLTTRQFVRYRLMRLDWGYNLIGFRYGGQPRSLASEILARFPELAPSA